MTDFGISPSIVLGCSQDPDKVRCSFRKSRFSEGVEEFGLDWYMYLASCDLQS
jgi:hypothetical protein